MLQIFPYALLAMSTPSPFKWRHFLSDVILLKVLVLPLPLELLQLRGDDA
jgi:hypothetical protein